MFPENYGIGNDSNSIEKVLGIISSWEIKILCVRSMPLFSSNINRFFSSYICPPSIVSRLPLPVLLLSHVPNMQMRDHCLPLGLLNMHSVMAYFNTTSTLSLMKNLCPNHGATLILYCLFTPAIRFNNLKY